MKSPEPSPHKIIREKEQRERIELSMLQIHFPLTMD